MNTEQVRADFEALERKRKGFGPDTLTRASVEPDNEYLLPLVQARWEGYQAARATLQSQGREDAERLDWLDKVAHCADWMEGEPTKRVIRAHDGAEFTGDTWREAIDHARRGEGEL